DILRNCLFLLNHKLHGIQYHRHLKFRNIPKSNLNYPTASSSTFLEQSNWSLDGRVQYNTKGWEECGPPAYSNGRNLRFLFLGVVPDNPIPVNRESTV
ncbi:hypothetical protein AVEN_106878-1, partial [Araneus ventricosus]